MSIDTQSCREFNGLVNGCNQGRHCPLRAKPCGSDVQHLRYHCTGNPPSPVPAHLTVNQIAGMDDTMENAHV